MAKKKKSASEMRKELQELAKPDPSAEKPPVDLKKLYLRVGLVLAAVWLAAFIVQSFLSGTTRWIPLGVALALTLIAAGAGVWLSRYLKKTQALGALLKGAD